MTPRPHEGGYITFLAQLTAAARARFRALKKSKRGPCQTDLSGCDPHRTGNITSVFLSKLRRRLTQRVSEHGSIAPQRRLVGVPAGVWTAIRQRPAIRQREPALRRTAPLPFRGTGLEPAFCSGSPRPPFFGSELIMTGVFANTHRNFWMKRGHMEMLRKDCVHGAVLNRL